MEVTEEQISDACNKAYVEAGHNGYFANGFNSGVRFVLEKQKEFFVIQNKHTLIIHGAFSTVEKAKIKYCRIIGYYE